MITKGLSFKMKASYNGAYAINKNAYAKKATYTPVLQDDGTYKYKKYGNEEQLKYEEKTGRSRYWYFEAGLNYNRSFGLNNARCHPALQSGQQLLSEHLYQCASPPGRSG